MAAEAAAGAHIYLLGDLCEVWVGDDDDGPLAVALTEVLKNAAKQTQVALMHGNRDFLFGEAFAQRVGAHLLEDPFVLDGQVLLSHARVVLLKQQRFAMVKPVKCSIWR